MKEKHKVSHIAYDLGAREFCLNLAKFLGQSSFLANFSRLLIDPNRAENSKELILSSSANIKIPGNLNIGIKEKNQRLETFHRKYHYHLDQFIKKKKKRI